MNKYDYGYDLTPGTTIHWAYDKIEEGSTVLELGPSNGNLVYHLTQEKRCIADIVEIDTDAGKEAARFCRYSCLGPEEGNLENECWFQKLKDNKYDYIVILDVLEHIRNPKEVLDLLRCLLKEEGTLLLSLPNIAHNSIIMNLLQNKFIYTNVGLLDETHVHFYTYSTLKDLLNSAGFVTVREQIKQEKVGGNEIAVEYGVLPRDVEAYLKTRDFGTAYQFLFTIKAGQVQQPIIPEYEKEYAYDAVVFNAVSQEIIKIQKINPLEEICVSFAIEEADRELRFDPLNSNCIITDLSIMGNNSAGEPLSLKIQEHTGNKFGDLYVFYDDDPQIYLRIPDEICFVTITYSVCDFDHSVLDHLSESRDIVRSLERSTEELKLLLHSREGERDQARLQFHEAEQTVSELREAYEKLQLLVANKDALIQEQTSLINELTYEKELLENRVITLDESNHEYQERMDSINSTIWGKLYCLTNNKEDIKGWKK